MSAALPLIAAGVALALLAGKKRPDIDGPVLPPVDDDDDDADAVKAEAERIVKESKDIVQGKRDSYSDDPGTKVTPIEAAERVKDVISTPAVSTAAELELALAAAKAAAAAEAAAKAKANTSKPKPGATSTQVLVQTLQSWLQALGAKLVVDGKFGPETVKAWTAAASARKLPTSIVRVNATNARVQKSTATALQAAAKNAKATPAQAEQAAQQQAKEQAAAKASSSKSTVISVATAQGYLNALGAGLKVDGLYGPKTATAWADAARARKANPAIARVDGKNARVDEATCKLLLAAAIKAKASTPAQAEDARSQPAPVAPATDTPPAGYNRDGASRAAPDIAKHLKQKGIDHYNRNALRTWQKLAGIAQDGVYGRGAAAALRHFVGAAAPKPFFAKGVDIYPWG